MARRVHHHHAAVHHDWAAMPLGRLSAQFETSGAGPGTVSGGLMRGGARDPGGVSYGTWQLASALRRPEDFLAHEGQPWRHRFERPGAPPHVCGGAWPSGGPEFSRIWRDAAHGAPDAFEAAQYRYMRRTHYEVQMDLIRRRTGQDLTGRSEALKNVVFSTATQHGPRTGVILRAMDATAAAGGATTDDRALINAIYDERTRVFGRDQHRYDRERTAALRMLDDEAAQARP